MRTAVLEGVFAREYSWDVHSGRLCDLACVNAVWSPHFRPLLKRVFAERYAAATTRWGFRVAGWWRDVVGTPAFATASSPTCFRHLRETARRQQGVVEAYVEEADVAL